MSENICFLLQIAGLDEKTALAGRGNVIEGIDPQGVFRHGVSEKMKLSLTSEIRALRQGGSFANFEDPDGTPIYLWEMASVPAGAP